MPRANLTTAVIQSAAADIADGDGYDAITISTIARRFGVQPASLYSHVRDLAAVKEGVQELALGELADRVAVAIAGRATTDALHGFADAHRRYATDRPGCWTAVQRPATETTVKSDAAARLSAQLLAVVSGYRLPASELVHAARFVAASVNGYLALNRVGAFDHRTPNPDTSWTRTIAAVDTALSAWPTEETENP
ncbi:TetR/AcrR family transcriptional regulator [Agromyces neolithicus]|uniref:TetR-like C-terminal domain-containing protein n=1 Tax=Agromyces neolithicus TaxID=269420 RepID=A0ABN2M2X3_9MICO